MSNINDILNLGVFDAPMKLAKRNKKKDSRTKILRPLLEDVQYVAMLIDFEETDMDYRLTFTCDNDGLGYDKTFRVYKGYTYVADILFPLVRQEDECYEDAIGRKFLISFIKKIGKDGKEYENVQIHQEIRIENRNPKSSSKAIKELLEETDEEVDFEDEEYEEECEEFVEDGEEYDD